MEPDWKDMCVQMFKASDSGIGWSGRLSLSEIEAVHRAASEADAAYAQLLADQGPGVPL